MEIASPVKYEVIQIGPTEAESMLERNTHNRPLRDRSVNAFAADMAAGRWDSENGQTIVIDPEGRIIDGQHRLWAIIQSDTMHPFLVVSNVPMSAQSTVDTGTKRTFGDVLRLRGESNALQLAAIVRRTVNWEAGHRRMRGASTPPSHLKLLEALERHPDLRTSASVSVSVRRCIAIPSSATGLCHWLFNEIDPVDCDAFFALLRGEHDGLHKGHPVRALHDTVTRTQGSRRRHTEDELTAYLIKAWNAWRDGRDVSLYRFKAGGAQPETFPEPC